MFEFCFTMSDGTKQCFPIFTQINEKPDPGPDPDPYFRDISIVASVYELASRLNDDELQRPMLAVATEAINAVAAQLPANVDVHPARAFAGR